MILGVKGFKVVLQVDMYIYPLPVYELTESHLCLSMEPIPPVLNSHCFSLPRSCFSLPPMD